MLDNLYRNWPVYLGVGGFVVFVIYALINSRQQEKKDRELRDKEKIKKDGDRA